MIAGLGLNHSSSADLAKSMRNSGSEDEKLKEACKSFESFFTYKMLQTMRNATMDGGLVRKSNGEKIFTDMLDAEYGDLSAENSVNGIADMLYNSMKETIDRHQLSTGQDFAELAGVNSDNSIVSVRQSSLDRVKNIGGDHELKGRNSSNGAVVEHNENNYFINSVQGDSRIKDENVGNNSLNGFAPERKR